MQGVSSRVYDYCLSDCLPRHKWFIWNIYNSHNVKHVYLQTDASNTGIGAVMYQEENGVEHPIAFTSKEIFVNKKKALSCDIWNWKIQILRQKFYLLCCDGTYDTGIYSYLFIIYFYSICWYFDRFFFIFSYMNDISVHMLF